MAAVWVAGKPRHRGHVCRGRREYATAGRWAREELLRSRASIASASAAPPPASRLSGVRTALPGRTLHRSERIH